MKHLTLLAVLLSTFTSMAHADPNWGGGGGRWRDRPGHGRPGHRPPTPRDQACFFEHPNFQGRSFCYGPGEAVDNLHAQGNMGDVISSVVIQGNVKVIAFDHPGSAGERFELTETQSFLRRANDRISSLRVVGCYNGHCDDNAGRPAQVCFFEHPRFRGRSFCYQPGMSVSDLYQHGMGGVISSIRVEGQLVAYIHDLPELRGEPLPVTQTIEDLRAYNPRWDDKAVSIRVFCPNGSLPVDNGICY